MILLDRSMAGILYVNTFFAVDEHGCSLRSRQVLIHRFFTPEVARSMDGDKFGDPRKRSQRGRGRGRRGRGTRGGPATRGRGRGAHRNKANVVEEQPHPDAIGSAAGGPDIESNAYRFEQYDALRSSARRDGVKQDVDFYSMPDNYDDDDDEDGQDSQDGAEQSVDVHVADAGNQDEGNEVDAMNLVADFSRLATVLASAPLWARLGSAGQFALNNQTLTLDQLVSDSDEEEEDNERDEHDNDMNDMIKELEMVDMDHDVDDEHDRDNVEKKEIVRTVRPQTTVNEHQDGSDDEFDKWLDNA